MKVGVVGAGVMGLSTAYFLSKSGIDVTVFEQKYLLYGASGRNSGGVSPMVDREELIPFALESLRLYDTLPSEVNFNFLFRKNGYIKLASDEEDAEKIREGVSVLRRFGISSKVISPEEVKEIIPDFNPDSAVLASYCREGGVIFPWPVVWGLARGCRENGVEIRTEARVEKIERNGSRFTVHVNGKKYEFDFVVNSAGAWSNEVSRMVGIEQNNMIIKEEVCVTESIKPYINPYIYDITSGLYVTQTARGEIIGGITGKSVDRIDTSSTVEFAVRYAKGVTRMIPKLKGLAMLRQWAGVYDEGRDGLPVVGFTEIDGFVQANGLGKHRGMMIAPALGKELAKLIERGENSAIKKFDPQRF